MHCVRPVESRSGSEASSRYTQESDTVLQQCIARNVPLLQSSKVGIEYEVANGGVVINMGEKRAEMKLRESDQQSLIMSFQVVEVHKPVLAVSKFFGQDTKSFPPRTHRTY